MIVGRFAPSPTGRMHLGNIFTAYHSWRSVKQRGGRWILRIEDLDPGRSRIEYARQIEDDLLWLGLDWDEGGLDNIGPNGPYRQSLRGDFYSARLKQIEALGLTYPCRCRRADILATQAPHQSDGRVIYGGTCRPPNIGRQDGVPARDFESERLDSPAAIRLFVPDREIIFHDRFCGKQCVNLARECGDFIIRRADGAWAYQLAVVVDDAMMGVTEVMRGRDLLLSAAQQIYIYELLGFLAPEFAHLPLICNDEGVRLSKRDASMSMEALRKRFTPSSLRGLLDEMLEKS